jgi:hypothetical protein
MALATRLKCRDAAKPKGNKPIEEKAALMRFCFRKAKPFRDPICNPGPARQLPGSDAR